MKIKDVMHKGVDWVSPDTPVTELAKLMRDHDVGAIPIGENDRLVGMVTDRDIVCKLSDKCDSATFQWTTLTAAMRPRGLLFWPLLFSASRQHRPSKIGGR